jgi:peptidylprolyl isomerase
MRTRDALVMAAALAAAALMGCKDKPAEPQPQAQATAEAAKATAAAAQAARDGELAGEQGRKAADEAAAAAAAGTATAPAAARAAAPEAEKAAAPAPGDDPLAAPPDVAAAPADAEPLGGGLAKKVLQAGTGSEKPGARDRVTVHYTGWTTDGRMFDSSVQRGQPATFPLNGVIKGWTEGLQTMVQGERARFWIPGDLAYGDTPRRPGAPAGTLVFDVELLSFEKAPNVDAPPDVSAPPADAQTTASGLAWKTLQPGTGESPTVESVVRVHYTGWTTDGEMFDSSVVRGQPASFPLNRVIPGWTEGLQLMKVGEKARFWIPGNLAYGDTPTRPGAPAGMLVFDVELLAIQ